MAWDTQRTRRLLLEAATAEFSERGLAGGRVDRIADDAGINKQRIYKYFGSKAELFDEVVAGEMIRVMALIPIVGTGREAVLSYAQRMVEHHRDDQTLARLLFWESLENRPPTNSTERLDLSREKVEALAEAVPGLRTEEAAELVFFIVALACSTPILGHVDRQLVGAQVDHGRRRDLMTAAVAAVLDALVVDITRTA
ncbi:TetR/AcrR family transcriptional regulator [Microbacterium sp. MYb62]|uniref:TetR/AcrR family transcriptional regulator n=1 Tax=Microbacterium sp. MYb62 TaxID=1848690 RepID=UPI000D4DA8FD|nr:TetR/AcrR family transcriptional regulator [Microbacterium sp. MYb62]PRB14159.1 TetR family transcriptional regulator [Microbacterium sp. MYb62]